VVYFGNKSDPFGAIKHMGDDLTGRGIGLKEDNEQIHVDLNRLPSTVDRLAIVVNIFKCRERRQHFGMVGGVYVRIVDKSNNAEIINYALSGKDHDGMTAMIVAEIYRKDGKWKFRAIGESTNDTELSGLLSRYR
jgi:stress response protein SCP2